MSEYSINPDIREAQSSFISSIAANDWLGVTYEWGGVSLENGLDCSQFTMLVMQELYNLDIPDGSKAQKEFFERQGIYEEATGIDGIDWENIQVGDMIFLNMDIPDTIHNAESATPRHVAFFAGFGSDGEPLIVDAAPPQTSVRTMPESYNEQISGVAYGVFEAHEAEIAGAINMDYNHYLVEMVRVTLSDMGLENWIELGTRVDVLQIYNDLEAGRPFIDVLNDHLVDDIGAHTFQQYFDVREDGSIFYNGSQIPTREAYEQLMANNGAQIAHPRVSTIHDIEQEDLAALGLEQASLINGLFSSIDSLNDLSSLSIDIAAAVDQFASFDVSAGDDSRLVVPNESSVSSGRAA